MSVSDALHILGAVGLGLLAFFAGMASEKRKQVKADKEAVTKVDKVKKTIEIMPRSQAQKELDKWSRR